MNTSRRTDTPSIELRLASRLASALTAQSQSLPHDVSERLRFARERAAAKARELRVAQTTAAPVLVTGRGVGVLMSHAPWWQRAASVLPLVVLVAGLLAIDRWTAREQVLAAADIDAQLLSDKLPPAAYSDPGFAEYLRSAPGP
jgi:hypothetical protein